MEIIEKRSLYKISVLLEKMILFLPEEKDFESENLLIENKNMI